MQQLSNSNLTENCANVSNKLTQWVTCPIQKTSTPWPSEGPTRLHHMFMPPTSAITMAPSFNHLNMKENFTTAPLLWSMLLWRCKSAHHMHDILHHSSLRPEGGTSLLPGPVALTNVVTVKKKMGPAFINSCWTRCNFYQSTISFKSPASTIL